MFVEKKMVNDKSNKSISQACFVRVVSVINFLHLLQLPQTFLHVLSMMVSQELNSMTIVMLPNRVG